MVSYQHRIGRADSKYCECGGVENVHHVLLQCSRWAELREEVYGDRFDTDIKEILGNPTLVRMFTTFMIKSGMLSQFRNCTAEAEPSRSSVS